MFKEMSAKFKVKKDTAYLEKGFFKDRSKFEFTIKRVVSGASAYGDRSAHILEIKGSEGQNQHYDTRYDGISTKKEQWLEFWKNYIEEDWGLELELIDYSEKEVEIEG